MCTTKNTNDEFCKDPFDPSKLTEDERDMHTMDCGKSGRCLKAYATLPSDCKYFLLSLFFSKIH